MPLPSAARGRRPMCVPRPGPPRGRAARRTRRPPPSVATKNSCTSSYRVTVALRQQAPVGGVRVHERVGSSGTSAACRGHVVRCTPRPAGHSALRLDQREQDRLADAEPGERHQQPVDAHAHAARWAACRTPCARRKSSSSRIASRSPPARELRLLHEALALDHRVDQLGVAGARARSRATYRSHFSTTPGDRRGARARAGACPAGSPCTNVGRVRSPLDVVLPQLLDELAVRSRAVGASTPRPSAQLAQLARAASAGVISLAERLGQRAVHRDARPTRRRGRTRCRRRSVDRGRAGDGDARRPGSSSWVRSAMPCRSRRRPRRPRASRTRGCAWSRRPRCGSCG